jgi:hypothetical protein
MGYLGYKPADKPLTAADITDSIITSAKITDGTITNTDIASSIITGQTAETSIAGGDSVLIYDDSASALRKMTRTNFVSGIGGTNTPAFFAYLSADQNISNGTWTKAQINTEVFDIGSCYDNATNYRFTPTAGKYLFTCQVAFATGTDFSNGAISLYKNGSLFITANEDNNFVNGINITVFDTANGTDYYEVFCFHNLGGDVAIESDYRQCHFGASKIIE